MKRIALFAIGTLMAGTIAIAVAAPAPPATVVTIRLPGEGGAAFKAGTGIELAQTYCLTCHSAAYVATQPVLSKSQWTAEVTKMKAAYAAKIPDEQVAPIAQYLTDTYGKP